MAYNIIKYDSSNLIILNNIETLNGKFISNKQDVIANLSNYVLITSNTLATHLNDLNSKIFDNSNLIKIDKLPVAKHDVNGSALGLIKVDGITITVDESGIIRGNSNIDLTAYATKTELSSVASGLTVLENADLATTANINLSGSVDYTTTTIDGSWPTSGSSILVKNQTNKAQNGIYILTLTSGPTYSTWQRRSDFNASQNIKKGSYIFVKRGVENKNTGFISSQDITTLNTDPIDFNLFTKTEITAGTGIAISGSTVSIKASANGGIVFNSDSAEINLSASSIQGILPIVKGGTGASSLANLINLDTDTNSILPHAKGGTGAQSLTNLINLDTDTNSILPIGKGGTGTSSLVNLINLSTDTNGVLPVAKGGTGVSTLVPSLLVVGNGTNTLQSANLSWNNDTNTLAATNIAGSGANITNINANNISSGILPIVRGGTGSSTLTADIITQGINNRFIINNKISLANQQDLRVATNILPDENDKYSLGSSNLRWKDIFVSANTITIGEAKLSSSPTGALEMSSISFADRINLITSNELHTLSGITKNVQQQINELNLDGIADGATNRYIKNDQYDGSITVYSNLNVGTYYSTENPNGNLRVFGDLILDGDITTFNPLITQIHRHLSNYNTGFIDIHNIDVSSNKPSIKIKHNTNYSNIFECYSKNDMELNDAVFIISSNGNVGIANNTPVEKLDVIGNIKYTGKINNISAAELDKLSGINYNIKQRIDNNNAQQSNFTLNISNILQTEYKLLDRNVSNFILNVSNILQNSSKETNVSNYILSVSNMLTIDYKRLDNNVSNYILNVSNILSTDYNALDKNVSNYVLVSNTNTSKYASNLNVGMSNYLATSITTTSNLISSRISSLTTDNITQGTQNKYITNNTYSGQLNINSATDNQSLLNITASQNNTPDTEIINIKKGTTELFKMISNGFIGIRKGTNLPTVPLDVEGDIQFTGKINDITAGELNNLKDINYNIKQRIDTNDNRQSNYISDVNTNLSQRIDTNDSRQSNYISDVNTNLSQRITNINTDTITQGTQKKFIIDDIYNGDLIINSNLTVHGSTTTLNTDVYTTERLDITNINQMSTALTVRQMGESKKIISALKDSEPDVEIFSVNTDGSIDVKGNINFGGDLFKGTEKFKASNWTSNVNGITSYSNVAIGKDVEVSSAYKLDVAGNVNISGDLYKGGSIFKASNWTSNADGITSYSNVAIGKDVAIGSVYKLDIGGNVGLSGELYKITNNYNYLIETVKSDLYVKDPGASTTSNLTAEPFVETEEKIYPPFRYFTSSNLTVEVQQQSINYSGPAILASGGGSHTVFLTNLGKVWASGLNTNGQLGIGNTTQQNLPKEITNASFYAKTITSIACGNNHTVFLTSEGKVWACGNPANGRLGLGTDITTNRTVPLEITNVAFYANTITAIATKDSHTVFLTSGGKVWSCGLNTNGQLGINNTTQQNVPIEITNAGFYANTITSIACGQSHTLFLTSGGKVWSCGNPANGRLGLGTDITTNRTVPLEITNAGFYANTITAIACGDSHSVFLTSVGKVWSCGVNTNGQLGINSTTQQNVPTEITNATFILNTIVAIACGQTHTLFLTSTGKVWACGNPANGRLGLGADMTTNRLVPTIISDVSFNLNTITSISGGYSHSIFLSNTSKAWTCGLNTNGQLAINNTTQQNLPTSLVYFGIVSFYGSGLYTVSYSSSTNNFEPFRCFNENSIVTVNKQGTWRTGNYLASGLFDSATYSTSNLISGYNGDWVVIKLPVSIKLKRFQIKQISSDLNKAPKNFQLYGSTNGTNWVLLVDKQNTTYNSLIYSHTDMFQYPLNTNKYYNHFGLVVSALLGNETVLSFDEFLIYGVESVSISAITTTTTKALTFTPSAIVSLNSYNITFPVPTVSHINNNSNLILQGEYGINLSSTNSLIIPKSNQYLPINATSNLTSNITFIYNLRNPIKTIEGAQWTYNSSNVNVYNLGSVGIGTTNPEYLLDVSGDIRLTGDLYKGKDKIKFSNWSSNINGISSYSNIAIGKEVAVSSAYKLDVGGAINSTSLNTGALTSTSLNTGALTSTSLNTGALTSTSYIRPSAGSGNNGIIFPENPGGNSEDVAWIKYYPRSGEACSLEIGINNNADDHIILQPNTGCVGINKVPESAYKLDVEGSIKFNGNLNKNINNINYAVETVRSELYLLSPSANTLTAEPTVSTTIAFAENVKSFTHSGGAEEQTTHTVAVGQNTICDILIIGGGGGGGYFGGGGGGAGGYYYQTNITIPAGNYTINVGKGGIAGPDNNTTGGNGGDTTFYGITAKGGGGGASDNAPTGNSGGSGGGAVWNGAAGLDNDTNTDGNNGGTPINTAGKNYGSGGGGADSTGFTNGNGGTGKSNSITGATIFYAAGGGGGRNQGTDWSGTGGSSIGGNGGDGATVGTSGLTGSGSGGGGGGGTGGENGGNGGSGIVIIRFKSLAGPTSEGNPVTHKTLSFAYIPPFDYAQPLVYNVNVNALEYGPPWELILPTGYTHFRVDAQWGGSHIYINDVFVTTLSYYSPTQYSQSYTPGQVFKITGSLATWIIVTLINTTNSYTLNFSVPTITDFIDKNTNNTISKLILKGNYEVRFTATTAQIVATSGQTDQFLPPSNSASILSQNISLRYNMRNLIKSVEGAQWTYNAANTSVYHLGNVGIGNTNPLYSLDIVGNMYVSGNIRTSDTITSFGDYSDERLKDREGNIENPLDIVGKLQGFYYRPNKTANDLGIKGNKMKRELGVSAQDVQKILPELIDIAPADISYDAENNVISKTGSNYLTVNYEKMIPLLIESIKELNKNINELKKENVELRDLIKSQ
jgi:alpha-tubulin suppressor-like RCC1 family protein